MKKIIELIITLSLYFILTNILYCFPKDKSLSDKIKRKQVIEGEYFIKLNSNKNENFLKEKLKNFPDVKIEMSLPPSTFHLIFKNNPGLDELKKKFQNDEVEYIEQVSIHRKLR